MAIYEIGSDKLVRLDVTTFAESRIRERRDLQRFFKNQIDIISPDTLVISEEFGRWEESQRRVDLLGIDKNANLVVIELKRIEDGGHMDLQAIRYAAMISTLTFDDAVEIFDQYLAANNRQEDGRNLLLQHLDWEEPDDDQFAQDVRIVLASSEFSKEITTAVIWLNSRGLDIRCVRLKPYRDKSKVLLDVQQIIPLPEAEEYQIRIRNKEERVRTRRSQKRDLTKYDLVLGETRLSALPKRRAIFSLVKYLCESGVTPDEIESLISWRNNLFRSVSGKLDFVEFKQSLRDQLIADGKKPDVFRYFTEQDELIYINERTYAFTKMWGHRTREALDILSSNFADMGISYDENSESAN